MVYLVVMVLVAAAGLTRLWLYQRRHAVRYRTIEGFLTSLESIAAPAARPGRTERTRVARVPAAARVAPLDPLRREAAKRRIEARRRAQATRGPSRRSRPAGSRR